MNHQQKQQISNCKKFICGSDKQGAFYKIIKAIEQIDKCNYRDARDTLQSFIEKVEELRTNFKEVNNEN